ncbi:MAG TPA: DUF5329 domain-containing protein [Steroidobacteraceae bacterium]|jgi:hypothetical protein|nr:DUF5329 domain-containing protein [Steroidobacteraceae bacterium]
MNGRVSAVMWLLLGPALAPIARTAPSAVAQTEIDYLLRSTESSACEFFRNGSWYDAKKAAARLRDKYEVPALRDRIQTADDFIEQVATKSSLGGQPYQVRCSGAKAVTTNQWLRDLLARYRAHTALSAPRPRRGALGTGRSDRERTLSRPV